MPTVTLATVAARDRLPPRRDPYWQRIEAGTYLGFRKMSATAAGTWIARFRDAADGKQHHTSLGEFADRPQHERFDAAKRAAEAWFKHMGLGGKNEAATVERACAHYVEHLRAAGRESTAKDAEGRFARWIVGSKFGGIDLQRLRAADVQAWRTSLARTGAMPQDKSKPSARPRAASSLNRDMSTLRAALNLALEDGRVSSDTAWKVKLRPVEGADGRRDVYLDIEQRRALIEHAAPDLATFLRALSLVPLRPGAMAALTVANFDARLATLTIGADKAGRDRRITLPKSTASLFAAQTRGKLPAAPLFARADGKPWGKDSWKYPFKDAVRAAGLPDAATAYALRHSAITDLIALHRLDTLTVAQLSGTSLQMIEKHYGHLLRDHAAKALASLSL